MSQSDLNIELKYKQLSVISSDLLLSIKKVSIITKHHINGFDVILETTDDNVYVFGSNDNGRLGLGHNRPVKKPTIIPELIGQAIKKIEYGPFFALFLNENSLLYICGLDQSSDSDNSSTSLKFRKPERLASITSGTSVDVKCCGFKVYVFTNDNYIIVLCPDLTTKISKISLGNFHNSKITGISCGSSTGLVITEGGQAFVLQLVGFNQVGRQIKLPENVLVKQISCADHHSIVLTRDGQIYCFGSNSHGQLAINTHRLYEEMDPKIIESDHKFTEIFAFGNTSMALSENNKIFVWGEIHDRTETRNTSSLFETNMSSFQEAINNFSKTQFTHKPLSFRELFTKKVHQNPVLEKLSRTFNDEKDNDNDLKFKLKRVLTGDKTTGNDTEDQFGYIFVNKWFIAKNSEHFRGMFAIGRPERDSNEIEINSYSYEACYQYIQYLYTHSIETEDIEVLFEMLSLSDEYCDDEFKSKCVQTIKPLRSVQNVCSIYSVSSKTRAKELEEFCSGFMHKYMNSISKTKDFKEMDGYYLKKYLSRSSKNPKIRRIE